MFTTTGQFDVGYCDFTFLEPNGHPEDPKKHVVGGIYYPSDKSSQKDKSHTQKWIPVYPYAYGFAYFIINQNPQVNIFKRILRSIPQFFLATFTYVLGHNSSVPAYKGLPISKEGELPVVLVSHGAGGQRMVQSCMCCELASQGFFVVALEHADGTASAVHLKTAKGYSWKYFRMHSPDERRLHILHRLAEMKTALKVFLEASRGAPPAGLEFKYAPNGFKQALASKLDMGCVTSIGHSFGGGPASALPFEENSPACLGVGLDPYWPPVPTDHAVYHAAKREAALLLIGSQSWYEAPLTDVFRTDKDCEAKAVHACSRESGGAGCVHVVMKGIGHASYTDIDLLFGKVTAKFSPFERPPGAKEPHLIIQQMNQIILNFLKLHLPLSTAQLARIQVPKPKPPNPSSKHHSKSAPGDPDWQLVEEEGTADNERMSHPVSHANDESAVAGKSVGEALSGGHEATKAAEVLTSAMEQQTLNPKDVSQAEKSAQDPPINGSQATATPAEEAVSRSCKPVTPDEKDVYQSILGEDGVFLLNVVP